ncbi:MAG: hypothetical protein ACRD38_11940, partial [Nitrososphaerales archaeon]
CDVNDGTGDTDRIIINSDGTDGTFMVNSIVVEVGIDAIGDVVQVEGLRVDGVNFDFDQSVVNDLTGLNSNRMAFDIIGASILGSGRYVQTIVAESDTTPDIEVELFCDADGVGDITIGDEDIIVSGWKKPTENISITYSET